VIEIKTTPDVGGQVIEFLQNSTAFNKICEMYPAHNFYAAEAPITMGKDNVTPIPMFTRAVDVHTNIGDDLFEDVIVPVTQMVVEAAGDDTDIYLWQYIVTHKVNCMSPRMIKIRGNF